MSWDDEKRKGLRFYQQVFEMELDVNTDINYTIQDPDSYNTPRTTQDPLAWGEDSTNTYRYSDQNLGFTNTFPQLLSVSITPAVLKIGEDVALSASANVTISDFVTNDTFEVPQAVASRRVTGSHFSKLFVRNYIQNRECAILQGYNTGVYDPSNFNKSNMVIQGYNYPNAQGIASFKLIDRLFFASEGKNKCPITSDVVLIGDITGSDLTLDFIGTVLGDQGIGINITNGDSGRMSIDNEILTYNITSYNGTTGVGTMSIGRGADPEPHNDGVSIQGAVRYLNDNVTDVMRDIIRRFTSIGTSPAGYDGYIDDVKWDAEKDGDLSPFDLTNTITKPTSVRELLKELIQTTGAFLYFDVILDEITLGAVTRFSVLTAILNEDEHILQDSLKIAPMQNMQSTRAKIYFGKSDFTETNDARNYANSFEYRNDTYESDAFYGQVSEQKTFFCNWLTRSTTDRKLATDVMRLKVDRFVNPPERFTFKLDAKYLGTQTDSGEIWYGSPIGIQTKRRIEPNGEISTIPAQIVSIKPDAESDTFEIQAIGYNASALPAPDAIISENGAGITIADELQAQSVDFQNNVVKQYVVSIDIGIRLTALNTGTYALLQGAFPAGATLYLVNQGYIVGAGGDGGDGGDMDTGFDGDAGGDGLLLSTDTVIDNLSGLIGGGGGGGGGSSDLGATAGGGGGAGQATSSGGLGKNGGDNGTGGGFNYAGTGGKVSGTPAGGDGGYLGENGYPEVLGVSLGGAAGAAIDVGGNTLVINTSVYGAIINGTVVNDYNTNFSRTIR